MIINHNLSAINSHRTLKFQHWDVDKNMEKLSSGMRINRAGDDASGLAVSEKMRAQISGLRQAERNAEDGMSMIQTAEGYLAEVADVLQRIRVLSIQSSNGIYTAQDRQMIQVEVSALVDEVDRIASQAQFNTMNLFLGEFARNSRQSSMWFHTGPNQHHREIRASRHAEASSTDARNLLFRHDLCKHVPGNGPWRRVLKDQRWRQRDARE